LRIWHAKILRSSSVRWRCFCRLARPGALPSRKNRGRQMADRTPPQERPTKSVSSRARLRLCENNWQSWPETGN